MKLGISVKIDVTKIDKARLFKGTKGTYLDLTTFIDTDNEGQYGDHGFISQSVSKDERNDGVQAPILGNVKVFFIEGQQSQQREPSQPHTPQSKPVVEDEFIDDIPFNSIPL